MKPLLFVSVIILLSSCSSSPSRPVTVDTPYSMADKNIAKEQPAQNWEYSEAANKIDGVVSKYAECVSQDTAYFESPYDGGATCSIVVRTRGNKREFMLTVSRGQFRSRYSGKGIRVKFDNGDPIIATYTEPSDASRDVIFLQPADKLITRLQSAAQVMVEPEFFHNGRHVFTFNTAGLKLD